jgi:hypothetical protein
MARDDYPLLPTPCSSDWHTTAGKTYREYSLVRVIQELFGTEPDSGSEDDV